MTATERSPPPQCFTASIAGGENGNVRDLSGICPGFVGNSVRETLPPKALPEAVVYRSVTMIEKKILDLQFSTGKEAVQKAVFDREAESEAVIRGDQKRS